MSELEYTYPFELWKTDHGIDGLDAKTWLVARFTSREKALNYLTSRDFTYTLHGQHYYHADESQRNTSGCKSYELRDARPQVPVDPE